MERRIGIVNRTTIKLTQQPIYGTMAKVMLVMHTFVDAELITNSFCC